MKRSLKNGYFITFEGIDGSGKSLQAESLVRELEERNFEVLFVRDPGGPALSETIRGILLDRNHTSMTSTAELFLYEAARSQLVEEVIRPAMKEGKIVLCDRFTDSTIAYQGYGRGIDLKRIDDANRMACGDTFPERTYILDVSWEESVRRLSKISAQGDRMENEKRAFFEKVRLGYQSIGRSEKNRVLLLDGMRTIDELLSEIRHDVLNTLQKRMISEE